MFCPLVNVLYEWNATKTNSCVHLNAIVSSWLSDTNVVCYIINHTKTRNAKTLQNVKLLDVIVGKNIILHSVHLFQTGCIKLFFKILSFV